MNWKKVRNTYTAEAKGKTFKIKSEKGLFVCIVENIPFCKRHSLADAKLECEAMVTLWGDNIPMLEEGNEYAVVYRTKKTKQCRKGVILPVEYRNSTVYAGTLRKAKLAASEQAPEGFTLYEVRTPSPEKDRTHTFYAVVINIYPSTGFDIGIMTRETDHIPENTHYTRTVGQIITTWFETEGAAQDFYNEKVK